jgi:hypothetical protein
MPSAVIDLEAITSSLTALGILSRAMLQFQPGELTERSAILSALEAPVEANSVASAILQRRRWIRWKRRALEV